MLNVCVWQTIIAPGGQVLPANQLVVLKLLMANANLIKKTSVFLNNPEWKLEPLPVYALQITPTQTQHQRQR